MSQVAAAMRRQLPIAQQLLDDLQRPEATPMEAVAPGMCPAELERLLRTFVAGLAPGGSPASVITVWVKVGPILHKVAQTQKMAPAQAPGVVPSSSVRVP